jgi:hypothetical protein
MSETAQRDKVGAERAGQPCEWCHADLGAEEQAAKCSECGTLHHESCWDDQLGCANADCLNAPLTRLDAPARAAPPRTAPGEAEADDDDATASLTEERDELLVAAPPRKKKKKKKRPPVALPGTKLCISCNALMSLDDEVCNSCLTINTPDGLYHGPRETLPMARSALIYAIVGIFFFGPILGGVAIKRAMQARDQLRNDPRYSGEGLAMAAAVVGVIDVLLWFYYLFTKVM